MQLAKSLHSQHRKSHRADQKRQHKEDDAVLYGVGNQHGESQQGEQSACQLEHEAGTGQQPRAQPNEQGQDKRQRRKENFQDIKAPFPRSFWALFCVDVLGPVGF